MHKLTLRVNGQKVTEEIEARTLLSGVLRDRLGLTGTHIGCDTSQCGACVVLVNGQAVKACSVLAVDLEGCEVTTIEGMAKADGSLGPIQQAFQEYHGLQCGFCTPGMVMSTAALLAENPRPTEKDVRDYLEGNICRCTGYQNIIRAVMAASGQGQSGKASEHV